MLAYGYKRTQIDLKIHWISNTQKVSYIHVLNCTLELWHCDISGITDVLKVLLLHGRNCAYVLSKITKNATLNIFLALLWHFENVEPIIFVI